ncbi:MAG: PD40 domain-containing protein [Acidobacteria bacterium]|nr:PD40 domain-containing protein [Acidobacteriota bacterium]
MRLTTRTVPALLVAVLLLAIGLAGQSTESAQALLRTAMDTAVVDGDLRAAITQYRTIVETFETDRAVAATALVQMADLYEKLGDGQFRDVYERIVREFADQTARAATARARLAALTVPQTVAAAGPTLQELTLAFYNGGFALSPDGSQVAYQNVNGTLAVRDIRSGAEQEFGQGVSPIWSPDGTQIAFSRYENYWNYEILIVSVDTGNEQHREVNGEPVDWSRDGRFILYLDRFGDPPTLNLLPVGGGRERRIDLDWWNGYVSGAYRFSPDGQYITYASRQDGNTDIYLLPIEGGESVRVTDDLARDYDPIWTADGRLLLFLSNRTAGRTDLWGVSTREGMPVGDPFVVRADVGTVGLFSLSDNGRLLFGRGRAEFSIYVTAIDPATHEPVGRSVKLGNRPLSNPSQATWSPDGQRIAYIDTTGGMPALHVMAADGTEDREIAAGPFNSGPFGWCTEEHVYVQGRSPATGRAIYRLSVSTNEQEIAFRNGEILGHVACSPGGRRLAFLRGSRKPQIYTADVDGNNLRQVTFADEDTTVSYPAWSPDGAELSFSFSRGDTGGVMVLSLDDGAVREATSSTDVEHRFYGSSWSPDGRRIAWYSRVCQASQLGISRCGIQALSNASGDSMSFEIRTSAVRGDPSYQVFPVNLGGSAYQPQWSPDGTKMLFIAGHYVARILLLDNFLPDAGTEADVNGQGPSR